MILLAAFLFAAPPAVPISVGEAAPFSGVLITEERAKEFALMQAENEALHARLDAQKQITTDVEALWRKKFDERAQRGVLDDPQVVGWIGFAVGLAVGVGAMYGGAFIVQTAGGGSS